MDDLKKLRKKREALARKKAKLESFLASQSQKSLVGNSKSEDGDGEREGGARIEIEREENMPNNREESARLGREIGMVGNSKSEDVHGEREDGAPIDREQGMSIEGEEHRRDPEEENGVPIISTQSSFVSRQNFLEETAGDLIVKRNLSTSFLLVAEFDVGDPVTSVCFAKKENRVSVSTTSTLTVWQLQFRHSPHQPAMLCHHCCVGSKMSHIQNFDRATFLEEDTVLLGFGRNVHSGKLGIIANSGRAAWGNWRCASSL